MVATFLIVGGIIAALGLTSFGLTYFSGYNTGKQDALDSIISSGGSSLALIMNAITDNLWLIALVAVVIFMIIRSITKRRRRRRYGY